MISKDKLYDIFLNQYGNRFDKIRPVLQYLNTYSFIFTTLKINNLLKPEETEIHQKEWVWLVSKYVGLEKEHFKPYWFPIEHEGYKFFIDLSDDKLPLFEVTFYIYEPYGYFNTVLFPSIKDLMLSIELNANFDEIAEQHRIEVWKNFKMNSVERNRLIFEGKIPIEPVNFYEVTEEDALEPLTEVFDGEFYTIKSSNVNAAICGLLTHSLPIKLVASGFDNSDLVFLNGYDLSIIRTIRELIHCIRMYNPDTLLYYDAFISEDKKDSISFSNGLFQLKTSHIEIKEAFLKAYNLLLNEPPAII